MIEEEEELGSAIYENAYYDDGGVSPKVRKERIMKRKPNPQCFLSSKKYAALRFGQTTNRQGKPFIWAQNDMKANKNGARHLIVLDDGTEYVGEWKNNLRHGYGEHFTAEGVYVGQFVDDEYCGKGDYYLWSDKTNCDQPGKWAYGSGEWKDGKQDGHGIRYYQNDDTYDGEFRKGKRHGHGIMYYANGDEYEGDWVNDQRCGEGKLTKANGDWFTGYYENDMRNGEGVLHIVATKRRLEGIWIDDYFKGGSYYDEAPDLRYVQPDDPSGTTDGLIKPLMLKNPEKVLQEIIERNKRSRRQ